MPALLGVVLAPSPTDDALARHLFGGPRYALPVGGHPLARAAVGALREAGADRILVALGDAGGEEIRAAVGPQAELAGVGAALAAAAASPALVHAGDALSGPSLLPAARALLTGERGGALALIAPDGSAVALLTPALPSSPRPSGDLESLLTALEQDGHAIERRLAPGAWRYDGTEESLLEGNRLALDALPIASGGPVAGRLIDSRVEGRVAIHPSALVERTTVRGPALIGPRAVVLDAFVGPYTTVGAGVRLEGAEVEHSLLLDGASIRHLDRRLEASVIGRDARIARRFSMPASVRLRVGRGAEVSLS